MFKYVSKQINTNKLNLTEIRDFKISSKKSSYLSKAHLNHIGIRNLK